MNVANSVFARSGEYGELISVSPPEEHHERRTFCVVKDGDYFEGQ
jgi:hypothetical protein